MKLQKIYKLLFILLISTIFMFLTGILRKFVNFQTSTIIGFFGYFVITIFFINRYKKSIPDSYIAISIFIGLTFLQIPLRIIDFRGTLISLPDFLFHLIAIFLGYLWFRVNKKYGIPIVLLFSLSGIYMYVKGYDLWIYKIDYGTFTGIVSEPFPECIFYGPENQKITDTAFKDKIVILDFWSTSCGVCFKKFPDFQKCYEKYQSNKINFYSVNIPIKRDTIGQAANILKRSNYSFPLLFINNDSLVKVLKITGVPTVFIIIDAKFIIYRGDIDKVDRILKKISKKI